MLEIIDLTKAPELMNAKYFMEHYYKFWSKDLLLSAGLTPEIISSRVCAFHKYLSCAYDILKEAGFPLNDIAVLIFSGNGSAMGHAFMDQHRWIAWFDLSALSSDLIMNIFIVHELVHAIHYKLHPELMFDSLTKKNITERMLVCEGVATLLTQKLLDITIAESLWADFLTKDELTEWFREYNKRQKELYRTIRQNFKMQAPKGLFDIGEENIYPSRSGYYVGTELIETIMQAENIVIAELILMTPIELSTKISTLLMKQ